MKNFAFAALSLVALAAASGLAANAAVSTVSDASFAGSVLASPQPVVVDFYADWCGPCRRMGPVVDDLSQQLPNVKFVRVNIDNSPRTAQRYGISSIPTVAVFAGGRELGASTGAVPEQQLANSIEQLLYQHKSVR